MQELCRPVNSLSPPPNVGEGIGRVSWQAPTAPRSHPFQLLRSQLSGGHTHKGPLWDSGSPVHLAWGSGSSSFSGCCACLLCPGLSQQISGWAPQWGGPSANGPKGHGIDSEVRLPVGKGRKNNYLQWTTGFFNMLKYMERG